MPGYIHQWWHWPGFWRHVVVVLDNRSQMIPWRLAAVFKSHQLLIHVVPIRLWITLIFWHDIYDAVIICWHHRRKLNNKWSLTRHLWRLPHLLNDNTDEHWGVTENRNTSTMRSFKIFSRWRHILFSISQFNNPNPNPKPNPNPETNPKPDPKPNPKPNPNPNPKPNPNGMFEMRQSFKHPF